MRYLSVIRKKSCTERNETDTCPLTDGKRVHEIQDTRYKYLFQVGT